MLQALQKGQGRQRKQGGQRKGQGGQMKQGGQRKGQGGQISRNTARLNESTNDGCSHHHHESHPEDMLKQLKGTPNVTAKLKESEETKPLKNTLKP